MVEKISTVDVTNVVVVYNMTRCVCETLMPLDSTCQWKGLAKRIMYVKFEKSITCHSKVMANVKVFADKQTDQKLYAPSESKIPGASTVMALTRLYSF